MSNPVAEAATPEPQSIQEEANSFLREAKGVSEEDFKAKLASVEDPALKTVIVAEKRYRDTQAAYTKNQQRLKSIEAENAYLAKLTRPNLDIDEDTRVRLEDLKYSNPEAWRKELDRLEREAQANHEEQLKEASQKAIQQTELENRAQILADFNETYGTEITSDFLELDVPLRISKKLEQGEISFEDYLIEVKKFIDKPKKIGSGSAPDLPNLSKVGGDSEPTDVAKRESFTETYKNAIF